MSVEDFKTDVQNATQNLHEQQKDREQADRTPDLTDNVREESEYIKAKEILRDLYSQTKDNPDLQKAFVEELNELSVQLNPNNPESIKLEIMSWIDTQNGIQKQLASLDKNKLDQIDTKTDNQTTRSIQNICIALGIDIGIGQYGTEEKKNGVDGLYGPKTTEGVQKIQTWLGIEPANGIFDQRTFDELNAKLKKESFETKTSLNIAIDSIRKRKDTSIEQKEKQINDAKNILQEYENINNKNNTKKFTRVSRGHIRSQELSLSKEKQEELDKQLTLEPLIEKISTLKIAPKWNADDTFIPWNRNTISIKRGGIYPNVFLSRENLGITDSSVRIEELASFLNENKNYIRNLSTLRKSSDKQVNYEESFADILEQYPGYKVVNLYSINGSPTQYKTEAVATLKKDGQKYTLETRGLQNESKNIQYIFAPWGSPRKQEGIDYTSGDMSAILRYLNNQEEKPPIINSPQEEFTEKTPPVSSGEQPTRQS